MRAPLAPLRWQSVPLSTGKMTGSAEEFRRHQQDVERVRLNPQFLDVTQNMYFLDMMAAIAPGYTRARDAETVLEFTLTQTLVHLCSQADTLLQHQPWMLH